MWIRSQDREKLVKTNSIRMCDKSCREVNVSKFWILGDNGYFLAEYTTKEKALQVLDMIEEHITLGKEIHKESYTDKRGVYHEDVWNDGDNVFQMPLDSEV